MKVLVVGWFSFEQMGATAGDLLSRDLICEWFDENGICHDVAVASPFVGGVDWSKVDPSEYSHLLFVCGPFGNGWPITELLPRFEHATLIGINLTMLESLDKWNPFDLLLERDSSRTARPDLSFLSKRLQVPVVGTVQVHLQKEYGDKALHQVASKAIDRLTASRSLAVVPIDTRLDENRTGLRTPAEVESLISSMDTVITTRLHGVVLAIKNGIPPLAIDPIAGGAKIHRQAQTLGWQTVFTADALSDEALQGALDYCLSDEARNEARNCRKHALKALADVPEHLLGFLQGKTLRTR